MAEYAFYVSGQLNGDEGLWKYTFNDSGNSLTETASLSLPRDSGDSVTQIRTPAIQSDGKVIFADYVNATDVRLYRAAANLGSVDSSFNTPTGYIAHNLTTYAAKCHPTNDDIAIATKANQQLTYYDKDGGSTNWTANVGTDGYSIGYDTTNDYWVLGLNHSGSSIYRVQHFDETDGSNDANTYESAASLSVRGIHVDDAVWWTRDDGASSTGVVHKYPLASNVETWSCTISAEPIYGVSVNATGTYVVAVGARDTTDDNACIWTINDSTGVEVDTYDCGDTVLNIAYLGGDYFAVVGVHGTDEDTNVANIRVIKVATNGTISVLASTAQGTGYLNYTVASPTTSGGAGGLTLVTNSGAKWGF